MIWQDQVSSAGRPSRGRKTVRLVSQYSSRVAPDMKGGGHARCAPAPDISHDRCSSAQRKPQHNQASLHLQYHTCDKHLLAYTPLRICYNALCYLWPLAKTTPWPEQSTREHRYCHCHRAPPMATAAVAFYTNAVGSRDQMLWVKCCWLLCWYCCCRCLVYLLCCSMLWWHECWCLVYVLCSWMLQWWCCCWCLLCAVL